MMHMNTESTVITYTPNAFARRGRDAIVAWGFAADGKELCAVGDDRAHAKARLLVRISNRARTLEIIAAQQPKEEMAAV